MKVQVIPENGNDPIKIVEVTDDPVPQIKEIQALIGGYIEQVNTATLNFKTNAALVDEDGRDKHRPANYRAMSHTGYAGMLAGTVVIVGLNRFGTKWVDVHE